MLASLGMVLPHAAELYGDKTALVFENRVFSFAELNDLSNQLAIGLTRLGITAGDIVTLYSANRWEWVVSYYGVLKLGAVINPINVMLTPSEVEFVVHDCGAKAILASGEKGTPILGVMETSDVAEIVLFDDTDIGNCARSFTELITHNDSDFEPVAVNPSDLSTICYTSGTTGHPKGAMQSHQSALLNAAMTAQMHVRTAADTIVTALPCPHVYGNVIMNGVMLYGMTLVLHATFVEDEILNSIERYQATMFEGVPTMYMYLLTHAKLDKTNLSSLPR